jgi:hypothetical protein
MSRYLRRTTLDVATKLTAAGPSPGDYVGLSIAMAHIEGIQLYREGDGTSGQSGRRFTESAKRIFPEATGEVIDQLWKDVRNGLFHSGFTLGPLHLVYSDDLILKRSDEGLLLINPKGFVKSTVDDFTKYVEELRENPSEKTGENFEKLWDKRWEEW